MPFPGFSASLFPSHSALSFRGSCSCSSVPKPTACSPLHSRCSCILTCLKAVSARQRCRHFINPPPNRTEPPSAVSSMRFAGNMPKSASLTPHSFAGFQCCFRFSSKSNCRFYRIAHGFARRHGTSRALSASGKIPRAFAGRGQRIRAHQRQPAFNCFHQHRQNHTANLRAFAHRRTAALLFVRLTANRTAHTLRQKTV